MTTRKMLTCSWFARRPRATVTLGGQGCFSCCHFFTSWLHFDSRQTARLAIAHPQYDSLSPWTVRLSSCQVVRLSGCQAVRLSGCLLGAPEQAPPGRGGAAAGPAAAGQSVAHQSPNDGGGEEGSRSSRPPSRCPSCPAARSPWHHRPPTDWATELGAVAAGGGGGRISSWSRLSSSSAPQTSTLVPIPPTTRARQYSSPHRFHFHANIPKIFTLTQISQEIFSRTEFSILPNFSPINFLRPTDKGGR